MAICEVLLPPSPPGSTCMFYLAHYDASHHLQCTLTCCSVHVGSLLHSGTSRNTHWGRWVYNILWLHSSVTVDLKHNSFMFMAIVTLLILSNISPPHTQTHTHTHTHMHTHTHTHTNTHLTWLDLTWFDLRWLLTKPVQVKIDSCFSSILMSESLQLVTC